MVLIASKAQRRVALVSFVIACIAFGAAPRAANAQTPDTKQAAVQPGAQPPVQTREQLIAKARAADSMGRSDEAFLIRTRLHDGDFDVGDVIIAAYEGGALTRQDSLVVQSGRVVQLPVPLGTLDLNGVLRFEVEDSVRARVNKYFKNEVVRVTPLIRLSVSGAAKSPGFYQFRPDALLSDVLMRSGGLGVGSDSKNLTIKRAQMVLWAPPDVQTALTNGMTLTQLELNSGDEVVVGTESSKPWATILQYSITVVTGLVLQYFVFRRR